MAAAGIAADLRGAIDRFIALSQCGIEACERRDADALAGALDARELVTRRVGELARQVQPHRQDAAWIAITERTHLAARLNRDLAERAASFREDIRQQLERVNQEDAAVGGYAGSSPRAAQLDLRR